MNRLHYFVGDHDFSFDATWVIDQPNIDPIPGGPHQYRLTERVPFWIDDSPHECEEGMEYDGASAPGVAGLLQIHPDGQNRLGSLFHDKLYRERGFGILSRKECDQIFYQVMKRCGYPLWRARIKYTMVRTFGRAAWND